MQPMTKVIDFLEKFAPLRLAEDWDNVGLLVGDPSREISSIMTCLSLTSDVANEAVKEKVQLIISHHPLLFRPVQKLTTTTSEGALLLQLIEAGIAVYTPHTAFDSASAGINQQWAAALELQQIQPLRPFADDSTMTDNFSGAGRWGRLSEPKSLTELITTLKQITGKSILEFVGDPNRSILTVGIACGSAAEFMKEARQFGCDVLITGEARFHACLEARDKQIALVLLGHYASERRACEQLAGIIQAEFPEVVCFASRVECDPINWL